MQLEGMDRRTITEDAQINYLNFYPYFLALALLLLVEFFLPEQEPAEGTPPKAVKSDAVFVLFVAGSSVSDSPGSKKK